MFKDNGILCYGITPPKVNLAAEKVENAAQKLLDRLENIDIDAIVIYDIQDESEARGKRTFDFIETLDPYEFYKHFLSKRAPAIIYKAVGKYSESEILSFMRDLDDKCCSVFVGACSKNAPVKTSLQKAYALRQGLYPKLNLGGICIPERHKFGAREHLNLKRKQLSGCEFFITQAVYYPEISKQLIDDYASLDCKKVPLIFTFTPCGCEKTLEFMKWLGIMVPPFLEDRLVKSEDMLSASVELCFDIFKFLYGYGRSKGLNIGANIESVSTRKVEIEASIKLLKMVSEYIKRAV